MKAPCKECEERVIGCHGQCDKYKAYRAERDKLLEEDFKRRECERYFSAATERVIRKRQRDKRGRKSDKEY